jgi:hypothetical protein
MRAHGRMPIRRDGLRVLGGTLDVHGEVVSGGEAGDRIGMRRAAQLHVQRRQLLRVRRHDVVLLAGQPAAVRPGGALTPLAVAAIGASLLA